MKKIGGIQFFLGVAVGAVVFGGSVALASGIMAQPKTAGVVIDGNPYDLKGYVIEGSHYFQLRDLASALQPSGKDFSVVWDGQGNRIVIDTGKGYDPNEQYIDAITTQTPAPTSESAMTFDEMKAEIVRLTNIERVKAGLPELVVLPALMDTAQAKADDIATSHYYGHNSPVYGTPSQMIRAAIPRAGPCAENLAPWTRTPAEAFAGWVESTEHYAIILSPKYTHIGVGVLEGLDGGYWWVQHFVGL